MGIPTGVVPAAGGSSADSQLRVAFILNIGNMIENLDLRLESRNRFLRRGILSGSIRQLLVIAVITMKPT